MPVQYYIEIRSISDQEFDSLYYNDETRTKWIKNAETSPRYTGVSFSYAMMCKPGYSEQNGACVACAPGKFSSTSGTVGPCQNCSGGLYQPESGKTSCIYCPVGFIGNGYDLSKCMPCPAGTYGTGVTSTGCSNCGAGKYNPNTGSPSESSCISCPAGTFASLEKQTACKECRMGTYAVGPSGSQGCNLCPSGKFNNITGAANFLSCMPCGPGNSNNNPFFVLIFPFL